MKLNLKLLLFPEHIMAAFGTWLSVKQLIILIRKIRNIFNQYLSHLLSYSCIYFIDLSLMDINVQNKLNLCHKSKIRCYNISNIWIIHLSFWWGYCAVMDNSKRQLVSHDQKHCTQISAKINRLL